MAPNYAITCVVRVRIATARCSRVFTFLTHTHTQTHFSALAQWAQMFAQAQKGSTYRVFFAVSSVGWIANILQWPSWCRFFALLIYYHQGVCVRVGKLAPL